MGLNWVDVEDARPLPTNIVRTLIMPRLRDAAAGPHSVEGRIELHD